MDVLFNQHDTPPIVFFLILVAGLFLAVRGIVRWRRKDNPIDWSTSAEASEDKPNYLPVGKQNFLLQQQKVITAPAALTPENITLESTTYKDLTEAKQMVENLFYLGGFYNATQRGKIFFVGTYGEVFYSSIEPEQGIRIEYAGDYTLASQGQFEVFGQYPISLGENLLPKITEDLMEYAGNV